MTTTAEEQEREHCENVCGEVADANGLVVFTPQVVDLVRRERAAAMAAGILLIANGHLAALQAKHQRLVAAVGVWLDTPADHLSDAESAAIFDVKAALANEPPTEGAER